jgi:hypothetical protein
MTTNKNSARASRGAETVIRYLEREPGLDPSEAATDAITDILHAYCDRGDELEAEELTRRAMGHFLRESDEEPVPAGRKLPMDAEGILYEDRDDVVGD